MIGSTTLRETRDLILSGTALCVLMLAGEGPAQAACTTNAPATGATVTCDTSAPNPYPFGVVGASGATDVTVNVGAGSTVTSPNILNGIAIHGRGSGWAVNNSGTVSNTGNFSAVALGFGGNVVNAAGGLIVSNGDPVAGVSGQFFSNVAVIIEGGPASVVNNGRIESNDTAVNFRSGGSITNNGTIAGHVQFNANGRIFNSARALIEGSIRATDVIITNAGRIRSVDPTAIAVMTRGEFVNLSGAEVTGQFIGVNLQSSPAFNTQAVPGGGGRQDGPSVVSRRRIINQNGATITARNQAVTVAAGNVTLSNSGTITGSLFDGVVVQNSNGTVVANLPGGTIFGQNVGVRYAAEFPAFQSRGNGMLFNEAGATITGAGRAAVEFRDVFNDTFTNAGTVNGNVDMGPGDDTIVLLPTGQFSGTVDFGAGTDTFAFDGDAGTTGNYTLYSSGQARVINFERIEKRGAGTWIFGGDDLPAATPAAVAQLLGGTTIVNANFSTVSATVAAGARLAGRGGLGGLTVNGTLAPGNSIGTFSVTGDLVMGVGSVLEAEIAGNGTSDRVAVSGTATLNGGTVSITALDPQTSYANGQTYTILTAGGGVTGRFASVASQSAFLSPMLDYADPNAVRLIINAATTPGGVLPTAALTYNQTQSSRGLDRLGQTPGSDSLAVYNQLLMLSAGQARDAYDLASGEIHASAQTVAQRSAGLFLQTLDTQGRMHSGVGSAGPGTVLSYSETPRPKTLPSLLLGVDALDRPVEASVPRARAAWLAPIGGGGSIKSDGNAGALDWYGGGLAGGYQIGGEAGSGQFLGGVAFGYLHTRADIDQRRSNLESDSINLGVYGNWTNTDWTISGSGAYTAADMSTRRGIVFGGISRVASADYWTHTLALSGEVARNFQKDDFTLSPFLSIKTGWTGHGATSETGAGALNLAIASASDGWFDAGLGLAVSRRFVTDGGTDVGLEARAGWEHAFSGRFNDQQVSLAGSTVGTTVRGPDSGADRFRFGLGAAFRTSETMELRARYDGLISQREVSHGGSIGLTVRF